MEKAHNDKISKNEILIFTGVLIIGIIIYFLFFGVGNIRYSNDEINQKTFFEKINSYPPKPVI